MELCVKDAVHQLYMACALSDQTKLNDAVSIATASVACLEKERGE